MESNREGDIRKGPWKVEEDEVLINHVSKYGPRDWSSIRSKGLLQRTGKSCRLRWVNKLRPNLKNGCKFSLEEERVVIELQAEFGNKWARIATYLPGRTDNDVKNFWSSRQKRLARILHTSQTSSSSTSHKNKRQLLPASHDFPILEGGVLSSSSEGESTSKILSCSSSCNNESSEAIKMVSLQDLFKPKLVSFKQDLFQPQVAVEKNDSSAPPLLQVPFPPQPEVPFSEESHEILANLDPYYDVFGNRPEFQLGAPFLGTNFEDATNPDAFFDDFPIDMFDQIEPPPSPSQL